MTRLGLIVRLLFRALVNTLFVLALLASAAIVLLWIIGRNKQLQERRQRRRYVWRSVLGVGGGPAGRLDVVVSVAIRTSYVDLRPCRQYMYIRFSRC